MRLARILAGLAAVVVAVPALAVALVFAGLNTDPGRRLAERLIDRATSGEVVVTGLRGRFPDRLRVARAEIRDVGGAWLTLDDVALDWSPLQLAHGTASVARLEAARVRLPRLPAPSAPTPAGSGGSGFTLPVAVDLRRLHVARLELGAPVAGLAATVAIDGTARVASLQDGQADATIRQLDGPGVYRLRGAIDAAHLQAAVEADEPTHGLLGTLAGLPDLGAVRIRAHLDGPRTAEATTLELAAGPLRATAHGTIDLDHDAADLDLDAHAPAMRPRPDVAWRSVALDAHVHGPFTKPDATAHGRIDGLDAAGVALDRMDLEAAGNAGQMTLHAALAGLRIPGPNPDLLRADPVRLQAQLRLDAPDRPVTFSLAHPLIAADGQARTRGDLTGQVRLTLPAFGPLAAMGGIALDGHAGLALRAAMHGDQTRFALDGTASVTGGTAPIPGLLGEAATLAVSGTLAGGDVTLDRAAVDGRTLHASATGTDRGGALDLSWTLSLSDLSVLSQAVAGTIAAHGRVQGPPSDFALDADASGQVGTAQIPRGPITASVHAAGLPGAPSGTVAARGTLDGAPLDLDAAVRRAADGALAARLTRADWKSAHAEGQATLAAGAILPVGHLDLRMTRLADLRGLLGEPIGGSLTAAADLPPDAPATLTVEARDAGLPGTGVARLSVAARVTDPTLRPVVSATLAADGIAVAGITGSARLSADGPQDALALRLSGALRNLAGADATLSTSATLDATARRVQVAALQAVWKGLDARLLAPLRVDFADGVTLDRLRLGVGAATLEVAGRASPTLDLTATLRGVTPDLARPFAPALDADGTLGGTARLTGTPARPEGRVQLTAAGVRMRGGPGRALPPAGLDATATLAGTSARIEARLEAGAANRLTLSGTAPLGTAGPLDLHASGTVDLAVADPILAADGRRVRGQVAVNSGIAGTLAAPEVSGTLRLADGELQDFAQGVHLTKLAAVIEAAGDSLRIASLTAAAGPGTISASGSVGVLAPDMPVDLTLTMHDARPLATDLLTAELDAALTLRGTVRGKLAAGGTLTVRRASITVPDRLPASVAVLDVRRAGQPPPPPPGPATRIALDLTIDAPGRIFVRGHGLDAELAGKLTLAGSTAAPRIAGGFDMRRGSFNLVGQTLTFTRGRVAFDGTGVTGRIDPTLDFQADVISGTTTATLLVGGYASAPKITLSSIPDMPQDEILAQLLFGQSVKSLGPLQAAEIAAALASIAGVGGTGSDPLSSVRNTLGLDRLNVGGGTGGSNSASVEAGRYVANGVYVGAKQGTAGASTQLQVQIDLYKGLKLETDIGTGSNSASGADSQSGSNVGLTYQFEY